jgi:hypothetical protein
MSKVEGRRPRGESRTMRVLASRPRILAGAALVVVAAAALLAALGLRDEERAPLPGVPAMPEAVAAVADAPPPARPAPPAALGPDPASVAARSLADLPASFARQAADEYRKRSRYPAASHPIWPTDLDPIARDREVTPVSAKGPNGKEPTLYVMPARLGFEAPEPVVLYAYLAVDGRPVPSVTLRGTLLGEDLKPIASFDFVDDGTSGDAVAGDDVRAATLYLPDDLTPELSASYLVDVRAVTEDEDDRAAATSFQYANPHARLTGRFSENVVDGSLRVVAEVEVKRNGRFHLEATLYDAGGTQPVAWAQTANELPPGVQSMALTFFGAALHDRGIDGPYLLRYAALSTTTSMPNAKSRVLENAFVTRAHRAASFSAEGFGDPDLLEAAERLERDALPRGLEAGG